jgi:hypothetical protein
MGRLQEPSQDYPNVAPNIVAPITTLRQPQIVPSSLPYVDPRWPYLPFISNPNAHDLIHLTFYTCCACISLLNTKIIF